MPDVSLIDNTKDIKNGSAIISCTPTGNVRALNTYVSNLPTIDSIAEKYNNRFDEIRYYTGGGSINGGTYTGA